MVFMSMCRGCMLPGGLGRSGEVLDVFGMEVVFPVPAPN